jgi:CRISPR/Cas system-associated exonuclease Cas4 (RecB family)
MMRTLEIPATTSASQLTSYAMCPRKYAFSYVYELPPEFTSTSLIMGSAFHSTVGWWHEERLHGRTPTLSRARDIFVSDLLAETSGADVRWKTVTPEALEAEGLALIELYLAEYGSLDVVQVEAPFRVDLEDPATGEIVCRPFRGYFDLVLADQTVVELKTSSKGWSEFDLARHLQLGGYAFVLNAKECAPARLDVHVIVRLKREPRVETFRIERAASATRWWFEAARTIEAAIESGHFPPTPSPLCRECEFESTCMSWTSESPQMLEPRRLPLLHDAPGPGARA